MSRQLAGPDQSHGNTTKGRIGRKPRKFRGKFEPMLQLISHTESYDLKLAEGVEFEYLYYCTELYDYFPINKALALHFAPR